MGKIYEYDGSFALRNVYWVFYDIQRLSFAYSFRREITAIMNLSC